MFLHKYIEVFLNSNLANAQVNILGNENVLLQIYKTSDAFNWGWGIYLEKDSKESFVFDLTFNKHKKANADNLERFKKSVWRNQFKETNLDGGKVYLFQVFADYPIIELSDFIIKILKDVYALENGDEFDVFVQTN